MNAKQFAAAAALSAISVMSAHADEADGSNGGTGFIGVAKSGLSREQVRTAAIEAQRQGRIPRGEM